MSDVLREFHCCQPLRQGELDAFATRGVSPIALIDPDALLRDTVVFDGPRFEFKRWSEGPDEGAGAIIALVRSSTGDPMDLVAWTPADDRLASWQGFAGMLGEDEAATARVAEGLRVHRSPMSWLQSSRQGVVIVDPRRAASLLRNVQPLEAEDAAHVRELRAALAEPPIRIVLTVGRMAA